MKANAQIFGNIQSGAVQLNRDDEIRSYTGKVWFFTVFDVVLLLVTTVVILSLKGRWNLIPNFNCSNTFALLMTLEVVCVVSLCIDICMIR